jgi:hypothetical protein
MSSSATSVPAEPTREKLSLLGRISTSPVYVFEKAIPDPYVLAVGLGIALSLAPNRVRRCRQERGARKLDR